MMKKESLRKFYFRSVLFHGVTKDEGGSTSDDVDPEHLAKRAKLDEEAHETLVNKAQQQLDDERKITPLDLRPSGMSDHDVVIMRQIFPDEVDKGNKIRNVSLL